MEVYFTRHARNRMRLYDISEADVMTSVTQPERVTTASLGDRHAWKHIEGNRWLRVTFKDEGGRRLVITVTPKRHAPGGTHAH
ncbi:MAG: DUF4258 domain-containing protein [Candidatus Omnitrophica bacterium]|nr:DUF4258 domain-containing protein [Candidatus Omnitrophota bacterium]